MSPGSAACFTYRLRSLLRYLAVRGVADPGLALAVPRVARWREATIPQFPTRPEIDGLLASCDRDKATGARDYAVLLLLARLGLRRGPGPRSARRAARRRESLPLRRAGRGRSRASTLASLQRLARRDEKADAARGVP